MGFHTDFSCICAVAGAPCGVMDQMASSLGKAGSLLALRCQPAEVEGAVHVPPHLRFWGIDSGIRCVQRETPPLPAR